MAVVTGEVFEVAVSCADGQATEAVFGPTGQPGLFAKRHKGGGAQLPGGWGVIGARAGCGYQAFAGLGPGLPETCAVGQAMQAVICVEARLLQRLLFKITGQALRGIPASGRLAFGQHQAGRCPRLVRTAPFNPGQALAVGAQCRCAIEVGTFGQDLTCKRVEVDADQSMLIAGFLDRQHLPAGKLHATVTASALGQHLWCRAVQGLQVQLLIGFVDEYHRVIAQAKTATAILVDPAAHAETSGCQAVSLAFAPVPDTRGGVLGAIFVPEQAPWTDPQFCEIDAGGNGECSAEGFSFWR